LKRRKKEFPAAIPKSKIHRTKTKKDTTIKNDRRKRKTRINCFCNKCRL
jgi:hypothetical protein